MVRLVFRPYTQIRRSICTSESLRASTRVSSGFTLFRHSSPSFGSQHTCSAADPSQKVRSGCRCTPWQGSQLSLSFRAWVFHPNTRMHVRLLGPCFKTGRLKPLCQHPKCECEQNLPQTEVTLSSTISTIASEPWSITHPKMPPSQSLYPMIKIDADSSCRKCTWPRSSWFQQKTTDFKRFPFNNFTYCLTLFSKFFSSFPHGTCALSVSRQYLALDGIYHPFGAAFPNNSTRWKRITKPWESVPKTGLSPSMMLFSKRLLHRPAQMTLLQFTTRTAIDCQI